MTSLLLLLPQSSSFFFFFISSSLSLLSVQVSLPSIQQQQQGSVICHKCTSPYVTTVYHWWYYNKLQLNRISKLDDVNDWKCLKMAFWDWKCRIWDLIVLICFFVVCLRLYGNTILSWLNEETVFLVYVYWCAYLMFCRMKDKNSHAHTQAHSLITLSLSLSLSLNGYESPIWTTTLGWEEPPERKSLLTIHLMKSFPPSANHWRNRMFRWSLYDPFYHTPIWYRGIHDSPAYKRRRSLIFWGIVYQWFWMGHNGWHIVMTDSQGTILSKLICCY